MCADGETTSKGATGLRVLQRQRGLGVLDDVDNDEEEQVSVSVWRG